MKTFNKSFSSIPLYLILVMIFFASTPRASARTTCGSLSVSISSPLNLGDVVGNTVPASGLVTVPDGEVEEVELVFVIDVSGSMEDDNLYERQNEIVTLISRNMELSRSVRMALVSFSDGAAIRQNLTNNSSTIISKLPSLGEIGGGTDIAAGLRAGFEALAGGSESVRKIVFLLTDGEPTKPGTLEAVRSSPYIIHTDFLGTGTGGDLMREIAKITGGTFFADEDPEVIAEFFKGIVIPVNLNRIEITSSALPTYREVINADQVALGRWFAPNVPINTSCTTPTTITARAFAESGICVASDSVTVRREIGNFQLIPSGFSTSIAVGTVLPPLEITLRNLSVNPTAFSIRKEDPATWYTISTTSGTAIDTARFTVTTNTRGLPGGTYNSAIIVADNRSCQSTLRFPISIVVIAGEHDGILEVPLTRIDRRIVSGRIDTFSNFRIRNVGHGALGVSVSDTAAWLANDLESTTLVPDEEVLVDLTFDARGLAANRYEALMDVSPNKGSIRTIGVGIDVVTAGAEFPTEEFNNDFDLRNRQIDYVRDANGYRYCLRTITALPIDEATHPALPFGNNESRRVALTGGARIPFFGVNYDGIYISSNGNLTFSQSDVSATPTPASHYSTARLSVLFADLNPATSGRISHRQLSDRIVVTWRNVPFNSTTVGTGLATAQAQLFFDGRITTSILTAAAKRALVGLSPGGGSPASFAEVNFLAAPVCTNIAVSQTVIASTTNSINLSCTAGTSLPPQTFTIRNSGTVDADFQASDIQPWLSVTPTVGRLTTTGAVITVDLLTASLPEGSYTASLRIRVPSDSAAASFILPISLQVTPPAVSSSGAIAELVTGSSIIANGSLTPLAFGTTEVAFAPLARGFELRNRGTNPLTTATLSVPAGYAILDGLAPSIPPNGADTFVIVLQTANPGEPAGAVTFTTNDSFNRTFRFLVEGEVLPEANPEIGIYDGITLIASDQPTPFGLGTFTTASGFANRDLRVRNTGRAALDLTGLSVTGDFSTSTILPPSLISGSEFNLRIRIPLSVIANPAGTIVIRSADPRKPSYQVPITARIVAGDIHEENDTLQSVLAAPSLPLNTDISNLEMDDLTDWYRIVPPTCGNLRITLTHEAELGNLNMEAYTAECLPVGVINKVGSSYLLTNTETMTLVNSGLNDLFIHVYGEGGVPNPRYNLRIDTFSVDDPYEPNDAPTGASLPQILRNTQYENLVLKNEDNFRVAVIPGSTITVRAEHNFQLGQIYMQVFPDDGTGYANPIGFNYIPNNDTVQVANLAVGARSTVLVRVYPAAVGNTNFYSLAVTDGTAPLQSAPAIQPPPEPAPPAPAASTIFTATDLALNTTVGSLSLPGGERWYRMALPTCTNLRVTMDFPHSAGDLNMQLYTAACLSVSGARLLGSSYSLTNRETVVFLNNGLSECYLRVYGEGGVGNPSFSLRADTLGVDDSFEPNDLPTGSSPRIIETGNTYRDLALKNDDFFSFPVRPGSTISVRVDHDFQLGQLYIQLLADDGSGFAGILAGYYIPNENIIEIPNFPVGTARSMIVRVYPAGVGNTNIYQLRVTQN